MSFPIKNSDYPNYPIKYGDFPIKNSDYPVRYGDFPIDSMVDLSMVFWDNVDRLPFVSPEVREDCVVSSARRSGTGSWRGHGWG